VNGLLHYAAQTVGGLFTVVIFLVVLYVVAVIVSDTLAKALEQREQAKNETLIFNTVEEYRNDVR
jgi:succinate dehydrogenase hydrophobic anchor subunit